MEHKKSNQFFALLAQIDTTLDPYFTQKAPQLPPNIQELLVKIAPYVTIIGTIIAAAGLLFLLGFTLISSPILMMYAGFGETQAMAGGVLGIIFVIVQEALQLMAIPGLFKRSRNAWQLLYLSTLVGLVYNLVSLNIIGFILNALINFYILYQIKKYYH